jgi:nucleotide-binding universal stress UspA family protein
VIANYIVVGVDGSLDARSALLWAADECQIRRRVLVIVHATDPDDARLVARRTGSKLRSLDEVGEYVLRDHAVAASARQPAVAVTTMLSHARSFDALTELSGGADLVVVGRRGHSAVTSNVLGSVSRRVAARAHCPVVFVPRRLAFREDSPRVVVEVAPTAAGRLALGFALEEARVRGATLAAVLATGDVECESGPVGSLDLRARASGAILLDELEAVSSPYPDVIIEPTLADSKPAMALLNAAYGAQLLVAGGHHSDARWSSRLGPAPSDIADQCPCPIVVVGQRQHASAESAGMLVVDDRDRIARAVSSGTQPAVLRRLQLG